MRSEDPTRWKVFYVGPLARGNLTWLRCLALEDLGATVVRFDSSPVPREKRSSLRARLLMRAAPSLLVGPMNRAFVRAVEEARPDAVYVDKGVYLTPQALRRAAAVLAPSGRRPVLLHFHPDDAFNRLIYHRLYEKTLGLYDCHFIPHRWVLDEHVRRGVRRAEYWPFGFYPPVHSPVAPSEIAPEGLASDVAFVGRWERRRAADLERLAVEGIGLAVWGTLWDKLSGTSRLRVAVRGRPVVDRELAAVATYSKITLGLLSTTNRDGHTARTFEIPACGGFMLAERSSGQAEFFEEGKEIACFGSYEELRDKIRWYLAHDPERERIRAAGLRRCRESGYSYLDRMRELLRVAEECREAVGNESDAG